MTFVILVGAISWLVGATLRALLVINVPLSVLLVSELAFYTATSRWRSAIPVTSRTLQCLRANACYLLWPLHMILVSPFTMVQGQESISVDFLRRYTIAPPDNLIDTKRTGLYWNKKITTPHGIAAINLIFAFKSQQRPPLQLFTSLSNYLIFRPSFLSLVSRP